MYAARTCCAFPLSSTPARFGRITCPAMLPRSSYSSRPTAAPYGCPRLPPASSISYETSRQAPTRRSLILEDISGPPPARSTPHTGQARDHAPVRGTDERLTRERQALLFADAIAERDVVPVLKRRDAHLRFVEPFRPFPDRPGLRHDEEVRARDRHRAHVFRIVTVVADGHADPPCPGVVDGRPRVTRCVVALFVEARVLGDVDHPGPRASGDGTARRQVPRT